MSKDLIRWLHLSDFHVGKDEYGQRRLFKYILENVQAKVKSGEGPDLVFITGDIADKGQPKEYALFEEECLKPLRTSVGDECAGRIYIVPGNHDVDRTKAQAIPTHGVLDKVPRFLDPSPEGLAHRKVIFERFQAFADWNCEGKGNHWLFSEQGGFCTSADPKGCQIGILGLNTAWLSIDNENRHKLSPGKGILETGLEEIEKSHIRIVLGHHPLDWLIDGEVEPITSLLEKYKVLYLHGHLHKSRAKAGTYIPNPFQPIQSGAAFEAREDEIWFNRFLWCALDFDRGQLIAEPLQWSRDKQVWIIDTDAFPKSLKVEGYDLWSLPLPGRDTPRVSAPKTRISNISKPNTNFTGRKDLLKELHDVLLSDKSAALTQPAAICGLGGVGKTQLAIEYAHLHDADYSIIWWIRSAAPAEIASDYAALAQPLDLPVKNDADQPLVIGAVHEWLSFNGGWLLIFDNAEDPEQVKSFIPQGGSGHVIITSRNPAWRGIGAIPLPVDVLPREEAIEFLIRRSGAKDTTAAGELADELGCLPLALEQAAAYIEVTGTSIKDYLTLFREHGTRVFKDAPVTKDYPQSVATTWEISFQQVEQTSTAARDMLRLFAFLGPENIPRDLLRKGIKHLPAPLSASVADKLDFNSDIAVLRRYSLVDTKAEGLSVHRLVQAVTRDRLSVHDQKKWAAAAVYIVVEAFPTRPDDPKRWSDCASLVPHGLAAAQHAVSLKAAHMETSEILNSIAGYLSSRARLKEAFPLLKRALRIAQEELGPRHPLVAEFLHNLGVLLHRLGHFSESRQAFEKALVLSVKMHGSDSPDVARNLRQ